MSAQLSSDIPGLCHQLAEFLAALEPTLRELDRVYEQRLVAFANCDDAEMRTLVKGELILQQALRQILAARANILAQAKRKKLDATDLRSLLKSLRSFIGREGGIDAHEIQHLESCMARVEELTVKIRIESWSSWHVVKRMDATMNEMRTRLAQGGDRFKQDDLDWRGPGRGGTLINARV